MIPGAMLRKRRAEISFLAATISWLRVWGSKGWLSASPAVEGLLKLQRTSEILIWSSWKNFPKNCVLFSNSTCLGVLAKWQKNIYIQILKKKKKGAKVNRQKDKGTVLSSHLSPWCWRSWARRTEKRLRWRLKNDGGQQWAAVGD